MGVPRHPVKVARLSSTTAAEFLLRTVSFRSHQCLPNSFSCTFLGVSAGTETHTTHDQLRSHPPLVCRWWVCTSQYIVVIPQLDGYPSRVKVSVSSCSGMHVTKRCHLTNFADGVPPFPTHTPLVCLRLLNIIQVETCDGVTRGVCSWCGC